MERDSHGNFPFSQVETEKDGAGKRLSGYIEGGRRI
jgi:hypothetical protein